MNNGILTEEQVRRFYQDWLPAMVAAQNSTKKAGSELEALGVVAAHLQRQNQLDVRVLDFSPGKTRPNFFVTYSPEGPAAMRKPILVAGVHMDCVPGDDFQFMFGEENGRIYGRGTFDNGSNVLASIGVLNFLTKTGMPLQRPVTVAFTADEEASATGFGFDGLVREGLVDPKDYSAAIFADTPWSAWNTKGVGIYSLDVKTPGAGHSGLVVSAGTVALDLLGRLQRILAEEFPEVGPYSAGSRLQANVFEFGEGEQALTTAMERVLIKGDLRTNPVYPLEDIVEELNAAAEEYIAELGNHPQVMQRNLEVNFKASVHEDGYVMPERIQAIADRAILRGFQRAGITGYDTIKSIGGGLPGLRTFAEQGLLTIATGAGGSPTNENLGNYHGPNESVSVEEVAKGPAYLLGVIEALDQELDSF